MAIAVTGTVPDLPRPAMLTVQHEAAARSVLLTVKSPAAPIQAAFP